MFIFYLLSVRVFFSLLMLFVGSIRLSAIFLSANSTPYVRLVSTLCAFLIYYLLFCTRLVGIIRQDR